MTVAEMATAIGKPVLYRAGALTFVCKVIDVKMGWGKPRFLIRPWGGYGEQWVEFSSIEPYDMVKLNRGMQLELAGI